MNWKRVTDFNFKNNKLEQWIYKDVKDEKYFNVEVKFGKPIDIIALKKNMISNLKLQIEETKQSRTNLFNKKMNKVSNCPICGCESTKARKVLDVYEASYFQCENCSHCYVINRPSKQQLEEFYSESKQYQSTYTDKESLLTRINQVVTPKLKYVINQYEKIYGRKPKSILDVGAGSGHFVYACRNAGIKADGIEISESGRLFCKENFEIDMYDKDFTECYNEFNNYDIITFWGVIEHVPYPIDMLNAAKKITSNREALVVVEVPRWESFSSSIQSLTPDTIIRHLDPLGHINFFTDESLATAFVKSGFNINSAWYFGMDMYEVISQFTYLIENENFINKTKKYIPSLQETLDKARLSDGLVLVGTPNKK